MFALSKHKLAVLVTSPTEPKGSIMKENISMSENTRAGSKRQGRGEEKKKRDSKAGKLMQVSAERKGSWQHSRQCVFPGHERLAAPNWDYPLPLGIPSDEQRRQKGRCREKLKEAGTEERQDRKNEK